LASDEIVEKREERREKREERREKVSEIKRKKKEKIQKTKPKQKNLATYHLDQWYYSLLQQKNRKECIEMVSSWYNAGDTIVKQTVKKEQGGTNISIFWLGEKMSQFTIFERSKKKNLFHLESM
jgi:hypothetical protein